MSHLFKTGNSIFKVGDTVYKVNDRLNILMENKGGFGGAMELLKVDPIAINQRMAISSGATCKIVDTTTFSTITSFSFGGTCVGMAWDSPNNRLYITAAGYLYEINTTTWTANNTGCNPS